jgi:ABC-2 type transport system permease protein
MRNIWIVARRELGALFVQPIAYVFAIFMTLGHRPALFGADLFPLFQGGPPPSVAQIISTFTFLSIFAAPAITMRLLAEEQQTGTIELLMTLPVTDLQVVLGKFLAAFLFYVAITALTLIYPIILLRFGNPDIGPMVSAYIGCCSGAPHCWASASWPPPCPRTRSTPSSSPLASSCSFI